MSAELIYECEWPGAIIGMGVDFELRAPREVAVQRSTACGARSGRRGQLAALGQLARNFIVDFRASSSASEKINDVILRT